MNNCIFYGQITSGPTLTNQTGINVVNLTLCVEKRRKKTGAPCKIDKSFLPFVAYDTAAKTIAEYAQEGDFLLISESCAKNDPQGIYFRINEFKILQNVQDFEYDD